MKLIADSGSTKTDWCVVDSGEVVASTAGQGINPFQQTDAEIENIINAEFASGFCYAGKVTEIEFYGAGCRDGMVPRMERLLRGMFANAVKVEVCSDVLGAARALFAGGEGIACILGTGANSCLYDGAKITANVPPLGYVLGDEGCSATRAVGLCSAGCSSTGCSREGCQSHCVTSSWRTLVLRWPKSSARFTVSRWPTVSLQACQYLFIIIWKTMS